MKILKAGTKVTTIIGDLQAIITGVCITMDTVEYKIRNGNATEVKDANIFHYIIFGAFICACYFSVKFILKR